MSNENEYYGNWQSINNENVTMISIIEIFTWTIDNRGIVHEFIELY